MGDILSNIKKTAKLPKIMSPCLIILFNQDEVIKNSMKKNKNAVLVPGVHETVILHPETIIPFIETFVKETEGKKK